MYALGYILGLFALYKFREMKLDIKYQKEIEERLWYREQQLKGEEIGKQMLDEIDRFMSGKKTIEDLIKKTFPEPKWIIEDNR